MALELKTGILRMRWPDQDFSTEQVLRRLFRAAFVLLGPSGLAQVLPYRTGQLTSWMKLLVM